MDLLQRAVELSKISCEAGEFPAGAVLKTKGGEIYESQPSLKHYHGEMMVIDMAIDKNEVSLEEATLYASMQPCLMCAAKMYWAGVTKVFYVIPKTSVKAEYAYENSRDINELTDDFFQKINMISSPNLLNDAMQIYSEWAKKIEHSEFNP